MIWRDEDLQEALENEQEIVWLMDISELDYVRTFINPYACRRNTIPKRADHPGKYLVGYAILKPEAKAERGYYLKRYFWLSSYDRYFRPKGPLKTGCPADAVDPRTVKPGYFGEVTDRAMGKKLEKDMEATTSSSPSVMNKPEDLPGAQRDRTCRACLQEILPGDLLPEELGLCQECFHRRGNALKALWAQVSAQYVLLRPVKTC